MCRWYRVLTGLGWSVAVWAVCWTACFGPGTAVAGQPPVVRFAYQDRAGSVLPMVAVEQKFFEAAGVVVQTQQFNNGPACAEALFTGAADVAGMGDTAAIILIAKRPDVVVLASHATGERRHRVMVKADASMTSLADLRGKRIGVKKGTSTYGGLLAALARDGVAPDAVTIVDLPPPTLLEALAAGSIDAFAASEPTPSVAEGKGARELADLGGLGNEYPILLVARKAYVAANGPALAQFFAALRQAQAATAAHPDAVAALVAAQSGLSLETTRSVLTRHAYALRADAAIAASLAQTAAFLEREKIIDHAPDMAAAMDGRFVEGPGR
ncbi:ABC transporter substrate-binding protein [Solidesulfovibrio sp.]